MAEKRLVLHVGAPKCGSTALQSAFAQSPDVGRVLGEKFRYASIDRSGKLLMGADIKRRATRSLSGAAPSTNAKHMGALPELSRVMLRESLNLALSRSSVVLSQEGWLERPEAFEAAGLLQQIRAPIDVVAYVRPQVDFLNASWWQWGAWSRTNFEEWRALEKLALCRWGDLLEAWRGLPNVRQVYPRLLGEDVVTDFFGFIGCPPPKSQPVNRSLPGVALRFLQRNRELRPGRSDVDIHFVLGRALEDVRGATPWVLPADYIAHVIRKCEASNRRLRALLDPEAQAKMDEDPRWWDAAAYAGKTLETPDPPPVDAESADRLAVALAKRLLEVEREVAMLKSRQVR